MKALPPLPPSVTLHSPADGLAQLQVRHPACEADLYLQGAHLTRFQQRNKLPLLFVSASSAFAHGKPIRGGVPIIFPWFGALDGQPAAPMHGFARTSPWTLTAASEDATSVRITLELTPADVAPEKRAFWPHAFVLRLHLHLSSTLQMDLEVENLSDSPFLFEEALHTYLHIADVQCADVRGLESHSYIDKTDHLRIKTHGVDPLRIVSETDRVFTGATGTCILTDPVLARRILVKKEHSRTTVVWNPWVAKAAAMADFGDHEWPGMICIETANTAPDAITLAPGGRHTMHTLIEEAPL